jgi:murein DD-endopeptidase MepM/ murein hydrolase activator NlpD
MNRTILLLSIAIASTSLFAQDDDFVKVYYENTETNLTIYANNEGSFPRSVKFELKYKGFKFKGEPKDFYLVPADAYKFKLIELELTGRGQVSFGYSYTVFMGQVNAQHDDSFEYTLPFRSKTPYKLTQSYYGKFSHQNKKALDFTMPTGTEIVAARAGKIIDIKEDSDIGCSQERCLDKANYVTILHDDGSFAQYYHLRKNGVEVQIAQMLEQGELIGYSGNTGFTSGAHLHFEVNISTLEGIKTVPTLFKINGKKQLLENGEMYSSERKDN